MRHAFRAMKHARLNPAGAYLVPTWTNVWDGAVANALYMMVVVAATFTVRWATITFQRGATRRLFLSVAGNGSLTVVVPSFSSPTFVVDHVQRRVSIPSNVLLVPLGDAFAIAALIDSALTTAPRLRPILVTAGSSPSLDGSFVCIGGASVNAVTQKLLDRSDFCPFAIEYPKHIGTDKQTKARYLPTVDSQGHLTEDYGFGVVRKNPWAPKSRIVLCFGVWAPGTTIAVRALLESLKWSNRRTPLGRMLRGGDDVAFVARARIDGLHLDPPDVVVVRSI